MSSPLDPSRPLRFELDRARVMHGTERLVLLPASALAELGREEGMVRELGLAVGAMCGRRVAALLGGQERVMSSPGDDVMHQLANQLSLLGLGLLRVERWGPAFVLVVEDGVPIPSAFFSAALEAAIAHASGRAVESTVLSEEPGRVHLLIASTSATERARAWRGEGLPWRDIVQRLESGGAR